MKNNALKQKEEQVFIVKKVDSYLLVVLALCVMLGCSRNQESSGSRSTPPASHGTGLQSKLDSARKALEEGKVLLINEGKYKCCITEVCDACALRWFECVCYERLKAKKDVCFECFDGWQKGKGVDPKIKKEDVRMEREINSCNVNVKMKD